MSEIIEINDDHGIQLLYISDSKDLEKSGRICLSKSTSNNKTLIQPVWLSGDFFVLDPDQCKAIAKWLTK